MEFMMLNSMVGMLTLDQKSTLKMSYANGLKFNAAGQILNFNLLEFKFISATRVLRLEAKHKVGHGN